MTTWANITKNSATFSNIAKNATTFANAAKTFLYSAILMETNDKLLMESGDAIVLETAASDTSWANISKN